MKQNRLYASNPILWGIFILFILPGLSMGLYGTIMAIVASSWTPVEATVENARVHGKRVKVPRTGKRRTGRQKTRNVRRLEFHYTYLWKGDTITNDRIAFLQGFSGREIDRSTIAQKLKDGSQVMAYVNPRNPQKAVLVRAIHNSILFGYVSAVSCFLFFVFISGVMFGLPSAKWGWRSLGLMILLYIVYFGIGIDRSVLSLIKFIAN